jgi:hypothetical protein
MVLVCSTTPYSDDRVSVWARNEADRKLAASTSPPEPQPAQNQDGSHKYE